MTSACLPISVLVVDDDAGVRCALDRCLKARGFAVETAASGLDALRLAQTRSYAAIVTDYDMPGMDGLALMERIRSESPSTAFIVLTGTPDLDLPQHRRFDPAIVSVLSKPFDEEVIVAALNRATELQKVPSSRAHDEQTVLLIEDNPDDACIVSEYLGEAGAFKVKHVARLSEALQFLATHAVDVILADLTLPDARGLDCVLGVQKVAPESALIVLSGLDNERVAFQAVHSGAQDYLVKGCVGRHELHRSIRYARERKRAERHLAQLAHFDQLTGLANRITFRDRLCNALARAERQPLRLAVLFVDLDHFKEVNDSLGHDAGDDLLQKVGERIRQCVREYDTVARLGGDEFAILLEDVKDHAFLVQLAERIVACFQQPFRILNTPVVVTTSIGIALSPAAGQTGEALVSSADAAMYAAKRSGRNAYRMAHGVSSAAAASPATVADRTG